MINLTLTAIIAFSLGYLFSNFLWRREQRHFDKAYKDLVIENQRLIKDLAKASKNDKRDVSTGRYTK